MIELNTSRLKPNAQIQKNVLYKIDQNSIIVVREEHDNYVDVESVNLKYVLKSGQYAVFGKEYRSPSKKEYICI